VTPQGIATDIHKIIAKVEEMKEFTLKEKNLNQAKYRRYCEKKGSKLFHV